MRRRFHDRTKHWEESWKYDAQRGIFDELRVVSCLIYLIHETLRRELKIPRAAGYFWRTSSCFMLDILHETLRRELKVPRAAGYFWRTSSCFMLDILHETLRRELKIPRAAGYFWERFGFWDFTGNILVFCIVGRLREVVAHGGSTLFMYLTNYLFIYF